MITKINEYLDSLEQSAVTIDGFDDAIIGITVISDNYHVVYNRQKCINILILNGMSDDEAEEYFSYNTERALLYIEERTRPIVVDDLS